MSYDLKHPVFIKYFIYFMTMFFFVRISQNAYWFSFSVLPFLLWFPNFFRIDYKHSNIIDNMLVSYLVFGILILFTGFFSPYSIRIPFARFSIVICLFFFFKLSLIDIKTKNDFIKAIDGIILAGLLYLLILYLKCFNGFAFQIDENVESLYGNKNTAGNILFLTFCLSIIRSYISNIKWVFFVLSTFLLISTFFTISLKCATSAFIIYVFFLFIVLKDCNVFIKSCLVLLILFFIPSIVNSYNTLLNLSPELQILADKFNIMIGNDNVATVQYGFVEDRGILIRRTWNLFLDNPFCGVGLENSRIIYDTYSHNTYVEILAGGGVILIIPFMNFIYKAFLYLIREWRKYSILIVIFVNILYISNALRIYDDIGYLFLIVSLVKCKQYLIAD